MSIEQQIMSAVVRVDMFLVSARKVIPVALMLFGVMLLIILCRGRVARRRMRRAMKCPMKRAMKRAEK